MLCSKLPTEKYVSTAKKNSKVSEILTKGEIKENLQKRVSGNKKPLNWVTKTSVNEFYKPCMELLLSVCLLFGLPPAVGTLKLLVTCHRWKTHAPLHQKEETFRRHGFFKFQKIQYPSKHLLTVPLWRQNQRNIFSVCISIKSDRRHVCCLVGWIRMKSSNCFKEENNGVGGCLSITFSVGLKFGRDVDWGSLCCYL